MIALAVVRKLAEDVFGEAWEAKGEKIYEDGDKDPQIWGIGHCHIDTAWWVTIGLGCNDKAHSS